MPATVPKFVRLTALALVCLPLPGCGGDPATQAEAEMQPGAYEVSLAGAPLGFAVAAQQQPKRCISGSASNVPTALVRPYMMFDEHCGSAKFKRTGNQLTGHAVCPLDPVRSGNGSLTLDFVGTITPTGLSGNTKLTMVAHSEDPDMAAGLALMNNVSLALTATRTGDCSGSDSVRPAAQRSRTTASGFGSDAITPPERSEQIERSSREQATDTE